MSENDSHHSTAGKSYLHTVQAGAWLPMWQSLVTGAGFGALILVIGLHFRWRSVGYWSLVFGILAFLIVWLLRQNHWLRLTAEHLLNRDLDNDGYIGQPPIAAPDPLPVTTRISLTDRNGSSDYHEKIFQLPATEEQLVALAAGINAGVTFAEAYWTGAGAPFSLREFRRLRAYMVKHGILEMVDSKAPNQGFRLTAAGQAIFSHFRQPTPEGQGL